MRLPQLQGPLLKPETVIAEPDARAHRRAPVEQLKTLAAASGAAWLAERAELSPKQLLTRDYPPARGAASARSTAPGGHRPGCWAPRTMW